MLYTFMLHFLPMDHLVIALVAYRPPRACECTTGQVLRSASFSSRLLDVPDVVGRGL